MATYDNSYSRFIAWAKIILPLLALALLSTLFLFSRNMNTGQTIPYADVDIEELAREPRITEPHYSGVTDDGAALSVFATTARPDPSDSKMILADALKAVVDTPSGLTIDIESETGTLDGTAETTTLEGSVKVRMSTGYDIQTEQLRTALTGHLLETEGEVAATGPLGTLNAGQVILERAEGDDNAYVLVFKRGVKLVYTPED
ncbi:LPS export ABC transporter periplasmic protein LptC [Aliiroseovarius sp. YM-037]|uniref:LPS export ABC transporter periplasmic protein LptC n=1 Tax=Aliiroseovarius sp. YM-037 TaxID=3341728 RepID=UPI003A80AF63